MQWADITAALTNYLEAAPVGQPTPANLAAAFPTIVNNAELRIYRDVDFLAFRGQNTSLTTTAFNAVFSLTGLAGQQIDGTAVAYAWPVVVEGISIYTPAAAGLNGVPVSLEFVSLDFIDFIQNGYGTYSIGACYCAMRDDQTVILCPIPDNVYHTSVTGVWRPAPMSSSNTTTWLGTYASDLFFSACMIEAEGFIRNFGAQSDDPRTAMSWETQYQKHWLGIVNEERRRKGLSPLPLETLPPSLSNQPRP